MSPSGSDTPSPARSESGFTLAEIVVAMVVASILVVGVVRFYKDSYKAYSISEQLAERDQNAHFVLNRFVEVLQQAGSSLPDTGWASLSKSGSTLIVGVNPRGAEHFVSVAAGYNNFVAVSDAAKFTNTSNVLLNTTHVLIDYARPHQADREGRHRRGIQFPRIREGDQEQRDRTRQPLPQNRP